MKGVYSGAFVIHRSDKRIRARSSVDRDLVLLLGSVPFSPDETVMQLEESKSVDRRPFSSAFASFLCVRGSVVQVLWPCRRYVHNSSHTLPYPAIITSLHCNL